MEKDRCLKCSYIDVPQPITIIAECSLIVFILNENVYISDQEKLNFHVSANSVLLLPTGSYMKIKAPKGTEIMTCSFEISKYLSAGYMAKLLAVTENDMPRVLPIKERLNDFLSLTSKYLQDEIDIKILEENLREELFIIFRLYYTVQELAGLLNPILGKDVKFKHFILNNSLKIKTIEELAKLANYSTSGFIKKFQRVFKQSPYRWITQHRVKRILQDICLSQKTFKDIADSHGFASHSYFYSFCKKHYGLSPTNVRKQALKIEIEE